MKNMVILSLIIFSLLISLTGCGKSSGGIIPIASIQKDVMDTSLHSEGEMEIYFS